VEGQVAEMAIKLIQLVVLQQAKEMLVVKVTMLLQVIPAAAVEVPVVMEEMHSTKMQEMAVLD
jgi:hypothetical protein